MRNREKRSQLILGDAGLVQELSNRHSTNAVDMRAERVLGGVEGERSGQDTPRCDSEARQTILPCERKRGGAPIEWGLGYLAKRA